MEIRHCSDVTSLHDSMGNPTYSLHMDEESVRALMISFEEKIKYKVLTGDYGEARELMRSWGSLDDMLQRRRKKEQEEKQDE